MTIPVDSLKEGMIFSAPVFIEGENFLVPAGVPIKRKDLDRLALWGIESVQTNGKALDPALIASLKTTAEAAKKEEENKDAAEPEANKGVYRTYMELIERLDEIINDIKNGLSIETRTIDAITGRLVKAVREHRNIIVGYILGAEVNGFELAKSSVNSAILSYLIAAELKIPNHKMMPIVIGAILHDLGMLRLPPELVEKKGMLSADEIKRMQAHPIYAYKIVKKDLLYQDEISAIVLQHHERWDGEGYPRKISGTDISLGARIVSVADAFEAMVSKKSYRNSMVGYQAMKNLLSDNSSRFDPAILKAFIQTMGIYPIGSFIFLNNGALARVVEVHATAPLRPKIQIITDEKGNEFTQEDGEFINLLNEKQLFITKAVDPREYKPKNA